MSPTNGVFNKLEWREATRQLQLDSGLQPWTDEEFDREWDGFQERARKKGIHLVSPPAPMPLVGGTAGAKS